MIGNYLCQGELFYYHPFFREIFKKYYLYWENYSKKFISTLIKCYSQWGGKKKRSIIGILFSPEVVSAEQVLLPKLFSKFGYSSLLLDFEKRNFIKELKKVDIVYRKMNTFRFLPLL